jgi:hypothetical protein
VLAFYFIGLNFSHPMDPEIELYKKQFNVTLEPFKDMLIERKGTLAYRDWRALVERTESGILKNPDQYLGKDLPEEESLNVIVKNIFEEFLGNLN